MEMTFIKPNEVFYQNKVGEDGVGIKADEFLAKSNTHFVLSKNNVDQLFMKR